MPKVQTDQLPDVEMIELSNLHLDPENPRLPEGLGRSEPEMLNHIATTTAIEDLVNAIAENNYFTGEPLVVVPHPSRKDHFLVVEGNRRLTALRLLQDPDEIKNPSARLKKIVAEATFRPTVVPCVKRKNRKEVLPYLGFRHITGVKEWEPLSKARYMRQLLEALTNKDEDANERYAKVARSIGSRRDHIQRNLDALAVYECAQKREFFGIDDLSEDTIKFGTLYTAMGDDRIGAFVGSVSTKGKGDDLEYVALHAILKPSVLVVGRVEELLKWLFAENDDGETALGESRNLKKLGAIVVHADALKALRSGARLEYAYRLTSSANDEFMEALFAAEGQLREAAGLVAAVRWSNESSSLVSEIASQVELIKVTLERKRHAN